MSSAAHFRRDLVRRGWDVRRWIEQRVSPDIDVPRGGYPAVALHEAGASEGNAVALTFDDGPHPEQTPRLLDLLAERGVVATFYLIGANARQHPDIVRRTYDEGHEIGNHTWSHRFLTTQTTRSIVEELRSTDEVIFEIIGERPATLRPPYGATTKSLAALTAHEFGYETVLWSVDSKDYMDGATRDSVTERVTGQTRAGSIVLLHDPLPETLAAMSETLDRMTGRGFRYVTVGELLALPSS